jgi:hypothetical protein
MASLVRIAFHAAPDHQREASSNSAKQEKLHINLRCTIIRRNDKCDQEHLFRFTRNREHLTQAGVESLLAASKQN